MINPMAVLPRSYFAQDARTVARGLLGVQLVREINGQRVSGLIVETEAYTGTDDLASHARRGRTPRNLPMWESPGYAYVYLTYGMHWLLNVVCEPEGHPAAVLIRAVEPQEGLALIAQHRAGVPQKNWTNGPARLTKALNITAQDNRVDMTTPQSRLWFEAGKAIPDSQVQTGARVGLGKAVPEPWFSIAWRWWVADNPHVSRYN